MKEFTGRFIVVMLIVVNAAGASRKAQAQEDDLFSTVRASSVFSGEVVSPAETNAAAETSRITSADDLVRVLLQAEFTASVAGSRAAVTNKQLDSWSFPVLVTISDDEQDLLIVLGLRAVSDSQKLPASRLLKLLETKPRAGRMSFVYNTERGRLELFSAIRNSREQGAPLRDEINRMVIFARDTESLWNLDEAAGGIRPAAAGPAANEASKTSSAEAPWVDTSPAPIISLPDKSSSTAQIATIGTLQGRWAASRSATEAFAMQLNADATFVIVSVINGRQSRSSGKFTLQNGQLTLEGTDGIRIVGQVRLLSASEFQFTEQTTGSPGAALNFRKAP